MKRMLLFPILIIVLFITSCDLEFLSDDTAYMPRLSSEIKYDNAEEKIKKAGFTDVSFEIIDDLEYSSDKDGNVEKITIDGKDKEEYKLYKKDAKVIIYYHTFPDSIKNYVSPNAYVAHSDYTEDDYKNLCEEIFEGFTLCFDVSGGEGTQSWSIIYYFNFELNLSIARYVRYGKGLPSRMYAYDIEGSIDSGWKLIDGGKIYGKYTFDKETNEIVLYDKNGNEGSRYAANKDHHGKDIEDVGHDAEIECLGECDYYDKHPYTTIYQKYLNTGITL